MYCIRDGKIYEVEPLRGRLYIRHGFPTEIRNGKRYAVNPADEWICKVYESKEEAQEESRARKARSRKMKEREARRLEAIARARGL